MRETTRKRKRRKRKGRKKKGEEEEEVIVEGSMKGARQAERRGWERVTRERKGERETCERALGGMVGLGSNRHGYGA